MRFEDWDILIFPGGEGGGHIPTPEFKVQCFSVHEPTAHPQGPSIVPLMTGFIPSFEYGAPFQVSVHSWGVRSFCFAPNTGNDERLHKHVWHVQVTVDGVVQAIEVFPNDVQWPKVVAHSNTLRVEGASPVLQFPPFHRSTMSQTSWSAMDDTGRIKVEVSEGLLTENGQGFHKLLTHAIFNFQPAPLELLQRAEIAWPNPTIMANPIAHYPPTRQPSSSSLYNRDPHQRNTSMLSNFSAASAGAFSSSPAFGGSLPGPPPPTPNYVTDRLAASGLAVDGSSRSTSAYTDISQSAWPLAAGVLFPLPGTAGNILPPPGYEIGQFRRRPSEVKLRIPSEQLDQLLGPISEKTQVAGLGAPSDAMSMPPPPLPQHAIQTKATAPSGGRRLVSPVMADSGAQVNEEDLIAGDRRGAARSNMSDVSMHANCENFPSCTSEDDQGDIIHHTAGVAPAAVMRSRKEGSADMTNRDFFSHVLNQQSDGSAGSPSSGASVDKGSTLPSSSPAIGSTKKRTRSTLKQLSVNEAGSPEKEPAQPARKMVTLKLRKRTTVTAGSDD